jgi:hypothetical protein
MQIISASLAPRRPGISKAIKGEEKQSSETEKQIRIISHG